MAVTRYYCANLPPVDMRALGKWKSCLSGPSGCMLALDMVRLACGRGVAATQGRVRRNTVGLVLPTLRQNANARLETTKEQARKLSLGGFCTIHCVRARQGSALERSGNDLGISAPRGYNDEWTLSAAVASRWPAARLPLVGSLSQTDGREKCKPGCRQAQCDP